MKAERQKPHNLRSKVVNMKKSTVIASVVFVLISILLVGMTPAYSQQGTTPVISNDFILADHTHTVVFYTDSSRTTKYVPNGNPLGESYPEPPEGTLGWLINGTETYLTADLPVTGDWNVTAVHPVQENYREGDFMQGVSGYLTAQTENNKKLSKVSALIADPFDAKNLKACFTETGTATDPDNNNFCSATYPPSVWSFEFVSCVKPGEECDYYVHSGGNYLNIIGDKITLGDKAALRVVKLGENLYNIKNGNGFLNLKYETNTNKLYFKSSNSGTYAGSMLSVSSALPMSEFYTLSFDVNGGNVYPGPKSVQAYAGQTITLPDYSGIKSIHTFEGWSETKDGTVLTEYKMPAGNTTLYAVYSDDPILWLDVNGGSGLETSSFIEGPITLPGEDEISRDGYSLIGWSEDKEATKADTDKIIAAGTSYPMPDHEVTLYAIWQGRVEVTFVPLNSDRVSMTLFAGDVIDLSENIYPYASAWYYDKNGTSEYIHVSEIGDEYANPFFTVPNHDVALYEVKTVRVSFDSNGGSGSYEPVEKITGEKIELPAEISVRDGSTGLAGWRTNQTTGTLYTNTYTVGQEDVTLYAAWSYNVSFETGGGDQTAPKTVSGLNGDGAEGQTLPEYAGKNGGIYDFVGWITVPSGEFDPLTTVVYTPETSFFEEGEDLPRSAVYYALYKVPVYLSRNSGTNVSGPDLVKIDSNFWRYFASPNEKLDLDQFTATRTNRTLLGWAPTEKAKVLINGDYYPSTTEENRLWAFWGASVTFDANGMTAAGRMPDPKKGFKSDEWSADGNGKYFTSFSAPAAPNFEKHNFLGWTDEASGNTVKYKVGDTVNFPYNNMKLYGLWDGYVKVRFSENNGSGDENLSKENKIYSAGAEVTMPSYGGSKSGFKFSGWSLSSNLEKNEIIDVYPVGSKYIIPDNAKNEIVFYAVWFKDGKLPPAKFGIRLDKYHIPQEPGNHPNTEFTTKAGLGKGPGKTNDWQIGNVLFDDAVISQHFILDNNHQVDPPKGQYYLANDVTRALKYIPSEADVMKILSANGVDFDPSTEFILWYVLKYQPDAKWNGTTYDGDYCWHVDGIILSRDKVTLKYDKGNTLPADHKSYWNLPDGFQVVRDTTTQVGRNAGVDGDYADPQLVSGKPHDGYSFIGWTLDEEGEGPLMKQGDPITLGSENVTLYAQWERPMKSIKAEKHWLDGGNAANTRPGSIIVYPSADDVKLSKYSKDGITLSGEGNVWTSAEISVPVHTNEKDHIIKYTWEEKLPDNYKDDYVQVSNTPGENTTVITNMLSVSSTVTKEWSDIDSNNHENDKVMVELKRSINEIDDPGFTISVELSEETGWSHTEDNLPKLEESSGSEYKYYWTETRGSEGYTTAYVHGNNNTTIINSRVEISITIKAPGDTWVYDGTPHILNSSTAFDQVILDGELETGDYLSSVKITGSQTVVGSSDNVPSDAVIKNAAGEDVTNKYNITYVNGKLEVTAKPITITADSGTRVYDGTPFTKNTYISTDLGTDDRIDSVTVTGSQTVVGSSDNVPSAAKIVNAKGYDVTSCYTITYVNGTLTVTKKAVTVTADSDTKVYDGKALTKDSYTYTDLASGDSIESVTVTGSRTVVGSTDNIPSEAKIVNSNNVDVTDSYEIEYDNGTLEVTKKSIIITADNGSKTYDGTALVLDSYKSTYLAADSASVSDEGTASEGSEKSDTSEMIEIEGGLASGDTIESVTVTGSQTIAGTSNNVPSAAKIVNADNEDVTGSYDITYKNGKLEVTKKAVTVTADSDTKVYDGTALTNDGYTHTGLAEGDSIESVTVSGSQTVVGTSDNIPSEAVIVNAAGEDVTASYGITYANGTLEITKKAVTVTAASDSKVYDGTALSKDGYTNTELVSGDSIESVSVTGSQTVVGTSDNVPSAAKIVNAAGEDVTGNYVITYANGTLEVTKKAVTITADGDTKVYDGTALTKDSYTNTDLASGETIDSVAVSGSQTIAGTSDNVPSAAKIMNADGEDVTASYQITYANGTLEVTQKEVTITADSDEKVYDGTALTKDSYINTDLGTGDSIESVTVTGSQTVAGSSDNVPSAAKIVNADGEDVTDSYKITYENGTLEVTQMEVTITADDDEKVYDGTALTKNSYTNTDLAAGDSFESVTVTGSQTVAGTSDNVPSAAKIVNGAGEDVTASYEIGYANGTLEVTKKPVTVTADSDTKIYDGTALTKNSYINTDLAAGDSIESVTVTGSQTIVGGSDNVPSAAKILNSDDVDVTASYDITYVNGMLEVTKKTVTITAGSDTKVYDGSVLTKNSYTNTDLAAGDKIDSVTVTGSQTVAGTSGNIPSAAKIVNAAGADVTASYEITYTDGTLEVTKKAVTVTADGDTKVYDGTALMKDSNTNTALAEGDSIETVTVTGSQTVVGSSENVPSAAVIRNADGEDVTASYEITYANGTLEVTKKAVTITADSDTKAYDGTALIKDSYTNTALAASDSIESVTVTGFQTVVGSSENVPSAAVIKNADGEDVTASYEITYANGALEVTKKAVTITADSDTKVYDGTALTKDSYTNTALAASDSIESVTVTGSQTVVGSSENVPSEAKIVNAAGEDVTASYEITYANGSLSVTVNQSAVITADSDTKVYDGTALTKDSYQVAGLATGDNVESVTVTGSQTIVGTSDNVPSAAKIVNAAGEDVTASYEVTYANGTLEVTKKSVTITADSDTKTYDGTALTKDSYKNTDLADGDSIDSVTVTGSQTVVGESANVPSAAKIVNAAGEEVTASYEISYANGTLEVTQKILTVTADSDTKVYDGTALAKDSYTNTDLGTGDSIESVTVSGSQTVVGSSDNVPSGAVIKNAGGEDVTASYAVTYKSGTLEVTQKAVTVTADSDTKVYDGTALTKDSYTGTGLVEGDSIESVTVTGSQIVVGSSDNVPSDAKIVNAAGEDVTASYVITYTNGTLEVTQKAVTITADSDTKTYDGTALTKDSYTNTDLAEGDSIESVTVTGSRTVVGTSDNVPSAAKIVNANGEDVTASYKITCENGTLEVTKKTVTVTADSDTKVYDGTALTKNSYTNTDLAAGDSIDSVTVTGSQIVVGESDNVPSAAVIKNTAGDDVTASYDITYANGSLEVTKKAVTITADSGSKVYDASALTKDSYTNTELASGDKIVSVTVTGSQTVVGSSDNVPSAAVITNAAGEDVTASYEITYVNGTLEVTKKAVTVTADSDTKIYDGTALTKDGYTNTALAAGDSIESVTVTGFRTVVGTSDNVPSAAKIVNEAGDDVTASYDISYANGTLEVTKMAVTVTADSDTKVYDGTALTKASYTNTALATGDSIESVTVTGSQTIVGSIDNVPSEAVIKNAAGEDVTESYGITYANGTLEVTKKAVTITADSDTKVYDGTALTKDSYTNTALAEGDSIDSVTVTGSQTSVGTSDNVPSEAVIVNAAGEDVTESYAITYAIGTLEVTKKAVTITADSDTKVYDGTALTKNSYTNTDLAAGDSIDTVTVTGSQTVVGTSDNVPSEAVIKNAEGEDVTASYAITYTNGTLEVTKKAVTITADTDTKVYDGTALTKNSYTNTDLAAGDSFESVIVTGSQTVVGTTGNVPSAAKIVNAAGEDVTASYNITYADGSLNVTVNQAAVITADSGTKVYDGTALTKDSYQAAGLATGDSVESVTVTGSQTVAGTSNNVPSSAKIVNAQGTDVTASYEVTYANGTLEVTKKSVTITAGSDTKTYDGSALTKNSYTNTDLAAGDSIGSVTVTGSQIVVGTSNNVPSEAKIVNVAGEDVTASYEITYANGTLEVTKKAVTITADSDTKVYDGTALTKESYTNTALAEGDSINSVTVTGSQTVVGSSDNVPSAAVIVNTAGEDVTASYEITYANGTLEVTKKAVTITADSDTKVYDGTALTKESYTNTALASGDTIDSVTVTGSQTIVGTSNNVPSAAKVVNVAGEDVTASYNITYANGTLEVTPKALNVTAGSDSKIYDGTALTKNSYANTELAEGDSIESVTVTGSQTVAGTSNNVPSAAKIVNAAGADVTTSYAITYANGTLEVTQKALTVTADSDEIVYDGIALTKNSYTSTELAGGDSFESVTVTGSQTVVGTSNNVPSAAKVVNAAGEDVTASYNITYANGTLEVTPKALTVTAGSDSKIYDGTALTKESFTNTELASGDSITVTMTGSQTIVGTSANTASNAVIMNADDVNVTASYDITYVSGTLEVTQKVLTITADSDTKVYDGTALTKDSYKNTDLASGDSIESVTVTGSQTVVGTSANTASNAKIVNAAGADVTASYNITYAAGTLEVTKKTVTITADSDTKVYDGTALAKNSYTNTDLAAGDSIESVTLTGAQTIVGTSANTASNAVIVNAAGEDVTASYEITYANGTLEVTKKPVTITADSDTKVYDGTALTKDSYTNTALAAGDSIGSVTVTGSQITAGTNVNAPSAAKIVNAAGEDVTASYEITYANGTLAVTKKPVTITAVDDTKVYDAAPLTATRYITPILADGDSIASLTVTGSQTVVGSSANVPSAAVIRNAAGENVTASYDITYANGTLSVTVNRAVIITAGTETKVYDGTALTKNSYHVTGLAEGDRVGSVTVTGSQTVYGTSANVPSGAKIVNAAGEDVTASYVVTYGNGSLTITKKPVTVTADSDTKVYDGTALTKDSYTNTALVKGDSFDSVTVTGSQTVFGSSSNVPSAAVIKNEAGDNVTDSYEITYANGTLEVTKKALTITADSDTKVYDGTALMKNSFTNTALAEGDSISSAVTGSQTIVGSSFNVPSAAKIVNARGTDVTASYEITYANGTLGVTQKAVTVTADSGTKVYDGTALTKNSYSSTALAAGDSFDSVTVTGSQTVAGSSDNIPSAAVIKNAAGDDVTASYAVTYVNGTLEVIPKAVIVTADSINKVYDGTALTWDSYQADGLAGGDSIGSVKVNGSRTLAGISDNVPSEAVIVNAAGEDVTASYEITYVNGTLEVTRKPIYIIADSETKIYDGTALTKGTFTSIAPAPVRMRKAAAARSLPAMDIPAASTADGDQIKSVELYGSQTDAGSSENVPSSAIITNEAGVDVTDSYDITYIPGTLTVTPRAVTIIADSDEKNYDGTELVSYLYKYTGLAVEHRILEITLNGSQTDVGSSGNHPTAAIIVDAEGKNVTDNYTITYESGTLTVTRKTVTITAGSDTKVYDGTALTNDSWTSTDLAAGDSIESVVVTGSQTVAGSSDNVPSAAVIRNADGEDVTENYLVKYVSGKLEVTKKALTITAGSDTKVYDGTALTMDSYTNTDLAAGDSIGSVTVTGSQTLAGSSENVPSAAKIVRVENRVNEEGENVAEEIDVTPNYNVKYVNGTLKVEQKTLTITADSDTKVYDGTVLTKNNYSKTGDLADGDRLESVTITGSQINAGTSDNVPSDAMIVNGEGENVTDMTASYKIIYVNGTLEVTKKDLPIRANSQRKVYDGNPLSENSYTVSGLASGDRIDSIIVEGSRIPRGESLNVVRNAVILNEAGENVNENYNIDYRTGTLTVDPAPVTVAADSIKKEYGQLDVPFTATVTGILAGEDISLITYELSREEGEDPGEYVITPFSDDEIQGNYRVIFTPGKLTITWNPTTFSAEKVWVDDNNRDGIRPVSLGVILTGSDGSIRTRRLTEANGWKVSIEDLPLYYSGQTVTYDWSEEEVPGYTGQREVLGNVTIFTNTHAIARTSASVTKIWDDRDNAGHTRPDSLGVILFSNGERLFGQTLNDENNWTLTVDNLPMYEKGKPVNYVWNEQSAGNGYYAVRSTASGGNTTLVNSNLYTMKVRYTFTDGSEAAPEYVDRLGFGETFVVDSPARAGYTAGQASVIGMMPSHDVEFTVIYTREGEATQRTSVVDSRRHADSDHEGNGQKDVPQVPEQMVADAEHPFVLSVPTYHVDIDDYGTALGLGEVYMTTGGTFSFE